MAGLGLGKYSILYGLTGTISSFFKNRCWLFSHCLIIIISLVQVSWCFDKHVWNLNTVTFSLTTEPVNNGEPEPEPEAEVEAEPAVEQEERKEEAEEEERENGKPSGTEDTEADQDEEDDQEYEVVDDTEATPTEPAKGTTLRNH